jgi:hypothetical protein
MSIRLNFRIGPLPAQDRVRDYPRVGGNRHDYLPTKEGVNLISQRSGAFEIGEMATVFELHQASTGNGLRNVLGSEGKAWPPVITKRRCRC